jgi:molybdate transport system substrate-binding protein
VRRQGDQRHRRNPGAFVRLRTELLTAVLVVALVGCSSGAGQSVAGSTTLTVYAAASLKSVLAKVNETYEMARSDTKLAISTDSSAALETKLEHGAPADVFLSADTTNPQKLVNAGLVSGGIVTFAANNLTIIVPAGNPGGLVTPADLTKPRVKIIAAEDTVPISKYASELVGNLAKAPGYPADFAKAYAANVVSKEDNVAAIVSKIELGEGDAGIVYRTDARTSTKVKSVAIPDSANVLATYGGVVLKASPNQAAAATLLTWLAGTEAQPVLASFGFLPPVE